MYMYNAKKLRPGGGGNTYSDGAVVSSEEETELTEEGEECLLALLEGFLLFLDFLGFLADFFLSFTEDLFLLESGSRLPRLVLCDLSAREGGPLGGSDLEGFGRADANCEVPKECCSGKIGVR